MPVNIFPITEKPTNSLRILLIGDLMGDPGLAMCNKWLPQLKLQHAIDGAIVNGENSAKDGRGITKATLDSMLNAGADVVTTGNHVWRHNEFYPILTSCNRVVRPANFPSGAPGVGVTVVMINNVRVAVINLLGRVFVKEHTSCPFATASQILTDLKGKADCILVDFHAEATSEKAALGHFLDGKVAAVVGTHTHVQTADAHILPGRTAFMTDLGCTAALNSCIGVDKEIIITHLETQLPARFKVAKNPPFVLSGAVVDIDLQTGLALDIQALRLIDAELII